MSDIFVKNFKDYVPNPTLRDVVKRQQEDILTCNEEEHKFIACLPGDNIKDHPLNIKNKWFSILPHNIKAAIEKGNLSEEELAKAQAALANWRYTEDGKFSR